MIVTRKPLRTSPAARSPAVRFRLAQRNRTAAASLAALSLATGTAAAQVVINPVLVEFGAQQRTASVTVALSEKAAAPMRLQAEVLSWAQDLQGSDVTKPSSDLLVSPQIAELQPGQKQLFRVALRGPRPAPGELAYRLTFEDVAPQAPTTTNEQGMTIQFRMRYDLPLLIAPSVPVQVGLRWKPCAAPAANNAQACVRLLNAGNRRVKVQTLTLSGDGWQQPLTLKEGVNILAGSEREWHVPLQPGQAGSPRGVQVQTVRGETLQADIATD
jgi:fimbrial chaperone protein